MGIYDGFVEYFNKSIRQYLPFKENKTYQAICVTLRDNFFKDSYLNIPKHLSNYVEDQNITIDLYDKLLNGNGYSLELLQQLQTNSKEKILEKLMHYQCKVGTLNHFKQICNLFKDGFNVYELYGDYRKVINDGVPGITWIMVPNPIFLSDPNSLYDIMSYKEVYNATPTYFISEQQLNALLSQGQLVLPFKTNLIFLDWSDISEFSIYDAIAASSALSYFQYDKLSLSVNNMAFNITVGDLYQLWQYLCSYAMKETTYNTEAFKNIMFGIRDSPQYSLEPGSPNSLDTLKANYLNIKDREEFDKFWDTTETKFSKYLANRSSSLSDTRTRLSSKIPLQLIIAYEDIIDSALFRMSALYDVLTYLDESLTTWIKTSLNPLAQQYEREIKLLLTKPSTNPQNTPTFKLLYEFKPYHTQFILMNITKIKVNDPSNNAWLDDHVYFVVHNWEHSTEVLSDTYLFKKNIFPPNLDDISKEPDPDDPDYNKKTCKYKLNKGQFCITKPTKCFGSVDVGDNISFGHADNHLVTEYVVQVIEKQAINTIVTEDEFNLIKDKYTYPQGKSFFESKKTTIIGMDDDKVADYMIYLDSKIEETLTDLLKSIEENCILDSSNSLKINYANLISLIDSSSIDTLLKTFIKSNILPGDIINSEIYLNIIENNIQECKNRFTFDLTDQTEVKLNKSLQNILLEVLMNYTSQINKSDLLNIINKYISKKEIVDYYINLIDQYINTLFVIDPLSFKNKSINISEIEIFNSQIFNKYFKKYSQFIRNNVIDILKNDNESTLCFDQPWPETDIYDMITIVYYPPDPIPKTMDKGIWSFPTEDNAKAILCNEEAFNAVKINDKIFVLDDGPGFAVKVVGKDRLSKNLILEKVYTGTAGSFNKVGIISG